MKRVAQHRHRALHRLQHTRSARDRRKPQRAEKICRRHRTSARQIEHMEEKRQLTRQTVLLLTQMIENERAHLWHVVEQLQQSVAVAVRKAVL